MSGDRGPVDYKEAKVLIVEDDRTPARAGARRLPTSSIWRP